MRILHVESALEAIIIMRPSTETAHKALYPVHLYVCLSRAYDSLEISKP